MKKRGAIYSILPVVLALCALSAVFWEIAFRMDGDSKPSDVQLDAVKKFDVHVEQDGSQFTIRDDTVYPKAVQHGWYVTNSETKEVIFRRGYEDDSTFSYQFEEGASYSVKVFVKAEDGDKRSETILYVEWDGERFVW